MSAHADKNELMRFVSGCLPLKRIFLVHGEEEQAQALFDTLTQQGQNAYIPSKNEEVLLE
jgi:Cft2 family RNA processing exonuclease